MNHFFRKFIFPLKLKLKNYGYLFMKVPQPQKWVFIVGCYNSGTTLLHDILALNSSIGSMPNEGQVFSNVLPTGRQHGVPRMWASKPDVFHLTEKDEKEYNISKLKRQWAFMYRHKNRPVLIEKTILNTARIRWLQKHFPNSYFIGLIRNGYAVAEGIKRKENHPIDKAIDQWKVSNEMMLADLEFAERKIIIHYEALVENPPQVFNEVCDFIGVDRLDAKVFSQKFKIHKNESQIKSMNEKSIGNLSKEELKLINKSAGHLLTKLGYKQIV